MNIIQVILQVLTLIGALVLFLYGMKLMSESLQKIAGRSLRNILARITSKPAGGILTGFLITSLIQSSSATTVMLVSFVNAGLVSFTESIGVVFGANIGTTVTTWLISILGFGSNFSLYSIVLPLVALALPLFFSYRNKNKAGAEFIIGFALLFIGIFFFRDNIPVIDENSEFLKRLQFFDSSFINLLMFAGFGILLTVIFQSSSATITLTMVLATQGWLSFDAALAMVLGENIGTTFTANVAAIVANRSAKRTAVAHLLFNVIGVFWALPLLGLISGLIQNLLGYFELSDSGNIAFGISFFHSFFNVVNTLILLLLFSPFKKICFRILPNGNALDEVFALKYIDTNLLSTSELSILQVRREIAHMSQQVSALFMLVPELLIEKREKRFARLFQKIQNGEELIDALEMEIATYISKISDSDLSIQAKSRLKAMLQIIDYLENISDSCYQMAIAITKKKEAKAWFTQELRNNISKEFNLIEKGLNVMTDNLNKDYFDVDYDEIQEIFNEIGLFRKEMQKAFLEEINREKLPYKTSVYYNDILSGSEKITSYLFNVNEAMNLKQQNKHFKPSDKKKQTP
ncbi:MAG: Na/Pi cotransporter family protein [Bacteroidales bacterium]|nr:Na/Pi cotransporter family protein [Bacteroidales bacterium]